MDDIRMMIIQLRSVGNYLEHYDDDEKHKRFFNEAVDKKALAETCYEAMQFFERHRPVQRKLSDLSGKHGFCFDIWDCGKCGNQLRETAKYCDNCGAGVIKFGDKGG